MGDAGLASLIRVVSFTFLFVPPLTFYRGSFQGNLQMVPTAVSQVVEQLLRVGVILVAASFFSSLLMGCLSDRDFGNVRRIDWRTCSVGILSYYSRKITGRSLAIPTKTMPTAHAPSLRRRF